MVENGTAAHAPRSAAGGGAPDAAEVRRLIAGFRDSQVIFVAVQLRLFDLIDDDMRSCEELAAAAHVRPEPLGRLLAVLAHLGLVERLPNADFRLTPNGAMLRQGTHS